jgi:hypothetical protein
LDVSETPPIPVPTKLTEFFWDGVNQHRLLILRCQNCQHFIHYPRPICERCASKNLAPEQVSGQATLYSYTVAMQAFHPYFVDRLPYVLAVVELVEEPGIRLTTNIINCPESELRTGLEVEVVFVSVTSALTLPVFQPRTHT